MNERLLHEENIDELFQRNSGALALERFFPRSVRASLLKAFAAALFFCLFVLLILFLVGTTSLEHELITLVSENIALLIGLASLFSALYLVLFALELFSLSAYFGGLKRSLSRTELYARPDGVSFDLLLLLYREQRNENLASIVFSSERARLLSVRLGMEESETLDYIENSGIYVEKVFPLKRDGKMLLISDLITLVYKRSQELQSFLFSRGVTEELFFGALDWTERIHREREKGLRAWSRVNLSEVPGIAKDWSFGGAYTLRRYATEVAPLRHASLTARHAEDASETILSQEHESNVLLVGERGSVRDSVTRHLALRLYLGNASPVLEGKRVFTLDSLLLTNSNPEKTTFEREFAKLLEDSAKAGNIILVIENIANFLVSVEALGVDVSELLDPFLEGDALQIVGTATLEERDTVLTRFPFLHERFEPVLIPDVDEDELVFLLTYRALEIEARSRGEAYFTFQAIMRTAELVRAVLPDATLPDDGIDILESAYTEARREGRTVIRASLIEELITERTGVPVGRATRGEQEQLLALEDTLRRMVVGQDDALSAVADALRRARSGLAKGSRPLGSFLFLGPTGVGKTQVARALEMALFERTDAMHRLDMSEYSGPDALSRLIGNANSESLGALEAQVARAPYGILLLDEFEKSSPEVRNLFLQILEEGFYTNARGKRVSLTNLVIIATSNAGSREIEQATREHKGLSWFKRELIEKLIVDNVFKPELLNRFDDIILFEPLSKEELREIAELELAKVGERVKGARVRIGVTDELLDFVVEKGYDPSFGARPMRRVIEQTVEKILSERILRNEVQPGSTVSFTRAELERAL